MVKAARMRDVHRARLILNDNMERLYYKDHWNGPPLDEADYQVILPFHTIIVNTAHAIITGMPPAVRVFPNRSNSSRDLQRADDVERWHLAVDAENVASTDEDPWDRAAFYQCLFGIGVIREVYNFPKNWLSGKHDLYALPRYPITQQALDPRQVFWERGNPPRGRFRTVFYEFESTVADIQAAYGVHLDSRLDEKHNPLMLDYEERRTVVDWWEWVGDELYHSIFTELHSPVRGELGGQWIKPPTPMPEYFVLPYHIYPFFETGSYHPHEWAIGPLYALTDIPHWMEILASRQMRSMELYIDPIILAKRGPNGSQQPISLQKEPGAIIDLLAGDDVSYLQWQGAPPDIQRLWELMDGIIHELAFSKVLMAQGSSDATGFRTALDRETSLLKIAKGLQNYERTRARLYAARAYAVGKLSAGVEIPALGEEQDEKGEGRAYLVSLTGDRVAAYRSIKVEVKPRFSGDLQRDINTATQATASMLWSLDDAMDYVPSPNGRSKQATRQSIVEDKLEFHPAVLEARARQIAAQIDLETQAMMEEAQGVQEPPPGAAGAPPMLPPGGGGGGEGIDLVSQVLGGPRPGPAPGTPGMPGTLGAPGQPAGASPSSPFTAGMDNRLRPMATGGAGPGGGPAQGTTTPDNIVEQLLRRQNQGGRR